MIEYTEALSEKDLAGFPDGAEKVRILSLLSAYGTKYPFLDFWMQKTEENITAVMMRFDGVVTLVSLPDADFLEIGLFLPAITSTLFSSLETAKRLGLQLKKEVYELVFSGNTPSETGEVSTDFNKIYEILSSSGDEDISLGDRDEFYADISHRTRKGCAVSLLTETGAAVCPFMTDSLALISGVAVESHARGKGEGKRAVLALVNNVLPRKIYVTATKEKAGFYEKCGFRISACLAYSDIK
jgi:N-acetylglutamate synthase-like GNAT family acetyltransferase